MAFETKVWEGDYRVILGTSRLDRMVARNSHDFASPRVYINNAKDYGRVSRLCQRKVSEGVLDDFVIVTDDAREALEFFGLTHEELGKGYVYSISEVVGLYLCKGEFTLHFSGDAILGQAYEWLPYALDLLNQRPAVKVVNLVCNSQYETLNQLRGLQNEDYYFGQDFQIRCISSQWMNSGSGSTPRLIRRALDIRSTGVSYSRSV